MSITPHLPPAGFPGSRWQLAQGQPLSDVSHHTMGCHVRAQGKPLWVSLPTQGERHVGTPKRELCRSFRSYRKTMNLEGIPCCLSDKESPAKQEPWVRSLGREDPLEKEMVTLSSILAWRILWTEEPGGLQSVGVTRSPTGVNSNSISGNKELKSNDKKQDSVLNSQIFNDSSK